MSDYESSLIGCVPVESLWFWLPSFIEPYMVPLLYPWSDAYGPDNLSLQGVFLSNVCEFLLLTSLNPGIIIVFYFNAGVIITIWVGSYYGLWIVYRFAFGDPLLDWCAVSELNGEIALYMTLSTYRLDGVTEAVVGNYCIVSSYLTSVLGLRGISSKPNWFPGQIILSKFCFAFSLITLLIFFFYLRESILSVSSIVMLFHFFS